MLLETVQTLQALQTTPQKNLNGSSKVLSSKGFFLTIFFYLPNRKGENIEMLFQVFQQYNIRVEKVQKKKSFMPLLINPLNNIIESATFVATSCHVISKREFEYLSHFVMANVIVLAFFYQNHIWNVSRLQKLNTMSFRWPHGLEFPFLWKKPLHVCWKNLNQISF